jgi:hypothetical protein
MQLPKHGEGRFTVQLADVPVVAFENQLAGKEDAVREVLVDSFRQLDDNRRMVFEPCKWVFSGVGATRGLDVIGSLEFNGLIAHRAITGGSFFSTVPEPSQVITLGLGLIGVLGVWGRRCMRHS